VAAPTDDLVMALPAAILIWKGETVEIYSAEVLYQLSSDDPEKHTKDFVEHQLEIDGANK
jgi:hypothetical protein